MLLFAKVQIICLFPSSFQLLKAVEIRGISLFLVKYLLELVSLSLKEKVALISTLQVTKGHRIIRRNRKINLLQLSKI